MKLIVPLVMSWVIEAVVHEHRIAHKNFSRRWHVIA